MRPQALCPAQIVQEVISDNSHDAEAKGLHLVNAVDPSLKMHIDPDLFLRCHQQPRPKRREVYDRGIGAGRKPRATLRNRF